MSIGSLVQQVEKLKTIYETSMTINSSIGEICHLINDLKVMVDKNLISKSDDLVELFSMYDDYQAFKKINEKMYEYSDGIGGLARVQKDVVEASDLSRHNGFSKDHILCIINEMYDNELDVDEVRI